MQSGNPEFRALIGTGGDALFREPGTSCGGYKQVPDQAIRLINLVNQSGRVSWRYLEEPASRAWRGSQLPQQAASRSSSLMAMLFAMALESLLSTTKPKSRTTSGTAQALYR